MAKKTKLSGYFAISKFLIASPYKIRPVATLVRNQPYTEALNILSNLPNKGARLLRKVVLSAGSNALNQNKQLEEDMLFVKEIRIDDGPRMRRLWCRARGRADMQLKRLCHIMVVVDEKNNKVAD
jgi:large subunit ribosomal protein L22